METSKMKAIVATGYGGPEVLQLMEVETPKPKDHEVLVRVRAASATTADSMMRTGRPYFGRLFTGLKKPKHPIPGTGFAGEVVQTGKKVTQFKEGDKVFGETTLGFSTNAGYVAVPENGVILPMPEGLSYAEGATFCDGPLTSLNFLQNIAGIRPGQKVLINGASGSLGTAAIHDYTKQDFSQSGQVYDIIFDTVGKSTFKKCKKVLSKNGQYISPVLRLSLIWQMIGSAITGGKKAKFAATGLKKDGELRALLSGLVDLFREGRFKIIIDRQFPLEKTAQAHQYIATGHKRGNVVIIVNP